MRGTNEEADVNRRADFPAPESGLVMVHELAVRDYARARAFYQNVLGGDVVFERPPFGVVKLANGWVALNGNTGPAEDRPGVMVTPPSDPSAASGFMNLRVADIAASYEEWGAKGAEFLTPPMDRGGETRCYMRDPDGYLIEVGQSTGLLALLH